MATTEERMKILSMIREGKISAEEGAKLLFKLLRISLEYQISKKRDHEEDFIIFSVASIIAERIGCIQCRKEGTNRG